MLPREGAPGWLRPVQRVAWAIAGLLLVVGWSLVAAWLLWRSPFAITGATTAVFCGAVTLFAWGALLHAMLPPVGAPPPLSPGRELFASVVGALVSLVPSLAYIAWAATITLGGPALAGLGLLAGIAVFDVALGIGLALPRLTLGSRGRMLLIGSLLALSGPGLAFAAIAGIGAIAAGGLAAVTDLPSTIIGMVGRDAVALVLAAPVLAGIRAALWVRAFNDIEPRGPVKGSLLRALIYVGVGMAGCCLWFPVPLVAEPYAYAWTRAWLLERARRRDAPPGGADARP